MKIPNQSEEEINKIRQKAERDFYYYKKRDEIQRVKIRYIIDGDDYEEDENKYLEELIKNGLILWTIILYFF